MPSGPSQCKTAFPCMGISIIKVRRSWDSLIFIMGIPMLVRRYLCIEMGPWSVTVPGETNGQFWDSIMTMTNMNDAYIKRIPLEGIPDSLLVLQIGFRISFGKTGKREMKISTYQQLIMISGGKRWKRKCYWRGTYSHSDSRILN